MSRIWVLCHLLWLSVEDILECELYMPVVLELGLVGFGNLVAEGRVPAVWTGLFLLGLGRCSKERIGYGDGFLVLALGMWMDETELLWMLLLSTFFCVVCALITGKKELPFVPFLTLAVLMGGWL